MPSGILRFPSVGLFVTMLHQMMLVDRLKSFSPDMRNKVVYSDH